jgi:hypothetical protein
MKAARKITVEVPAELSNKAQHASGSGITQTVRTGLERIAASRRMPGSLNSGGRPVSYGRRVILKLTDDRGRYQHVDRFP